MSDSSKAYGFTYAFRGREHSFVIPARSRQEAEALCKATSESVWKEAERLCAAIYKEVRALREEAEDRANAISQAVCVGKLVPYVPPPTEKESAD